MAEILSEIAQPTEEEQTGEMAGGLPSAIGAIIISYIINYAYPDDKGWVFGPDATFRLPGLDKGKQPDVAFVNIERLKVPDEDAVTVVPDLAVEVLSKTDSIYDAENKAADYLKAGVKLVWIVRPISQIVEVYQVGEPTKFLTRSDELDGNDVLPGFKLKVSAIFRGIPPILPVNQVNSINP